jgi:brefeldin A-inhibited guanine nucleotide-exchange protein
MCPGDAGSATVQTQRAEIQLVVAACLSCSDDDPTLPHSSSQPSIGGAPNTSSTNLAAAAAAADGEAGSTSTSKPSTPLAGASSVTAAAAGDAGSAGAGAAGSAAAGDALSKKRAYKEKWQEGIALFNSKPKKGIGLLQVSVL